MIGFFCFLERFFLLLVIIDFVGCLWFFFEFMILIFCLLVESIFIFIFKFCSFLINILNDLGMLGSGMFLFLIIVLYVFI